MDSLETYQAIKKVPFKLKECFAVLKDHPKWNVSVSAVGKRKMSAVSSDFETQSTFSESSETPSRPMGAKKAKGIHQDIRNAQQEFLEL